MDDRKPEKWGRPAARRPHAAQIAQTKRPPPRASVEPRPHAATLRPRASLPTAQPRSLQRAEVKFSTASSSLGVIEQCTGILIVDWKEIPTGWQGKRGVATGILIDSQHVLTCAHNVAEAPKGVLTGNVAAAISFYPGLVPDKPVQDTPSAPSVPVACCFFHAKYGQGEASSSFWDVAILRLGSACTSVSAFPKLIGKGELAKLAPDPHAWMVQPLSLKWTLHGYRNRQKPITVTELDTAKNRVVYGTGFVGGTSGSPVCSGDCVNAVHIAERDKFSFAVGLFNPILEFIDAARRADAGKSFVNAFG